ncbi:hypothetical protein [Bradyrhizobium sp. RDT46]|uniref:hypothetical protein n=1 Tax=Bradyrhizobium sp. RDT46 TaxID=3341829 RepID=UPI0035C6E119
MASMLVAAPRAQVKRAAIRLGSLRGQAEVEIAPAAQPRGGPRITKDDTQG